MEDDYKFFEDGWNQKLEKQPICKNCKDECSKCLFNTLEWSWHRWDEEQSSEDNDEVFNS